MSADEPLEDAHSFDEWIKMFSLFYPRHARPADWAWPLDVLRTYWKNLDKEDTAFFCIIADLSDRLTPAISPLDNPVVLKAYETYFDKPRDTRCFADYNSLVEVIIDESQNYRRGLPEPKNIRGKDLLEWCSLADAFNQSTLGGDVQPDQHTSYSSKRELVVQVHNSCYSFQQRCEQYKQTGGKNTLR